ncbi:MAG: hypothetical protein D8M58_17320 [Calditrichaeota bacterium]|nr:MAG: hypothetical protein DWQ03_01235 [Calditrichota bacterium]MBL1207169.1 hypothetical protein [Calditrichota bacterium]NOG47001.1 hypothetical protein [Calditrichota bacterium]
MILNNLKVVLAFFVLIQSLLFQVSLPELVLCFGDDGHIALESSERDADHKHDKNHFSDLVKLFNQNDSDDCTDINLDWHFSNADVIKKSNKNLNHNSFVFVPNALLHTSKPSIKSNINIISNTNKHTITSIQTTILLI